MNTAVQMNCPGMDPGAQLFNLNHIIDLSYAFLGNWYANTGINLYSFVSASLSLSIVSYRLSLIIFKPCSHNFSGSHKGIMSW